MPQVDLSAAMTWRQLAAGIAAIPAEHLDDPVLYDVAEVPKSRILLPRLARLEEGEEPIEDDESSPLPGPTIEPGSWYLWG